MRGNSPSGLQCRATLIVPSASAPRPRGRESAEFLFHVQADLTCRAALPVLCASAPGLKSIFFRPPTSPFFMQCKRHCKCGCTQRRSSGFRYPRRSGLAELIVLYEGTNPAVVCDDSETGRFRYESYLDVGPAIGIFIFTYFPYRFLPRLFLCTPSFRRCGVTGAVCCGSGWISLLPLETLLASGIVSLHGTASKPDELADLVVSAKVSKLSFVWQRIIPDRENPVSSMVTSPGW